jgi:hypothetical protein
VLFLAVQTSKILGMKAYFHEEDKYIDPIDYMTFNSLMGSCDFTPEEIDDPDQFNSVFHFLLDLNHKAPNFVLSYEYALGMLSQFEPSDETETLQNDLEQRKIKACEYIAQKDDIFKKKVVWGCLENRPIIRGLMLKADKLWDAGQLKEAHELFSQICKTNPDDNIGARYPAKATKEGMSLAEFNERFVETDGYQAFYKGKEIMQWFEGK